MKWITFKIKTITEAEDVIISSLYDIGLEGAQIEDKVPLTAREKEQMFVDILPEYLQDDGIAYLSFYVEEQEGKLIIDGEETDIPALVAKIKEELTSLKEFMDIGEGSVTVSETEDRDWINNWKQYFHQFMIDDVTVVPSWEEAEAEDAGKIILHMDPGTAFGTGMHETTQLCIRQLRKYITAETSLLDVGCGSGILSILALKFGAARAVGTDIDPGAEEAVRENCQNNAIQPDQFTMIKGNIITDENIQRLLGHDCFDLAVANILADVLILLTPVIARHLKKGGIYITSGIIANEDGTSPARDVVVAAINAADMSVLETTCQGEWLSVTARKN